MILILFFCPQGFSTPHTRLIGHTQQHGQPSLARFCFRRTRTTHIRQEQKQRRKRVSQNHGSAVHRASQRTAPAIAARCIGQRSALRLTHVPPSMPAATSSTKKLALLHHTHENTPEMHFAPPAHTHENASKDTYPACLYTERALPSHILPAYSPQPNHSSISCKREKSKTHGYARAIRVQNGTQRKAKGYFVQCFYKKLP